MSAILKKSSFQASLRSRQSKELKGKATVSRTALLLGGEGRRRMTEITEARRTAVIFAATARIASEPGVVRSQDQSVRLLKLYEEIMRMDAEAIAPISIASIAERTNCRVEKIRPSLNTLVSLGVISRRLGEKRFRSRGAFIYRPVMRTDFRR